MDEKRNEIDLRSVFHDTDRSFDERRNEIIRRIRASEWLTGSPYADVLSNLLDDLACAEDPATFDPTWDEVCDLAEIDHVLVRTR